MTGRLRAGMRLLRCTFHIGHGVLIVLLRFERLGASERHAHVRWWARKLLRLMAVTLQVEGQAPSVEEPRRNQPAGRLIVANHVSWLDMSAIHAVFPQARFVSKAAVKRWPLLSRLADAGGTLYLERERKRDALRVVGVMAASLGRGDTVAVFPESTTSDGHRLLPFHANLLQAAIANATPVQPVALRYVERDANASPGAADAPSRAVEFVGETTLVQSMWRIARADGLTVRVVLLPLLRSAGVERRALATQAQSAIVAALQENQALP